MVAVSYFTEAPNYATIEGLTYGTTTADHKKESRSSWTIKDVIASVILVLIIIGIYIYFSG
jgi:SSS family solute:Na+ symporter